MTDLLESVRRRWRNTRARLRDSDAPVTLVTVMLMLGFVLGLWLGRWWVPEESGATSATDRAQLSEAADKNPAPHAAHTDPAPATNVRLGRCEEVYAAEARPLEAVGPAMSQWEVHIGAMNKLVVGAISLEQAQDFWNQTRRGAARNLAEFGAAQRAFNKRTARCPRPGGQASDALHSCADGVWARNQELGRAAAALHTWRVHVGHMEMLRRGEMTPAEATQMWLESWRAGSHQVDAYRNAAREARRVAASHGQHEGGAGGPCAG